MFQVEPNTHVVLEVDRCAVFEEQANDLEVTSSASVHQSRPTKLTWRERGTRLEVQGESRDRDVTKEMSSETKGETKASYNPSLKTGVNCITHLLMEKKRPPFHQKKMTFFEKKLFE